MFITSLYKQHKKIFQLISVIILAIILRLILFPIKLYDYLVFLANWWEIIQNNGGIL